MKFLSPKPVFFFLVLLAANNTHAASRPPLFFRAATARLAGLLSTRSEPNNLPEISEVERNLEVLNRQFEELITRKNLTRSEQFQAFRLSWEIREATLNLLNHHE